MGLLKALFSFREEIREAVDTAIDRDPAARSRFEVALMYPGVHALAVHRFSNRLYKRGAYTLARGISQFSRAVTGIEIHPGATIGRRFFIDHGMGVVIGETTEIGDDVTIFHGVTLGGTSTAKIKRHPTVESHVVIGAHATVLGPVQLGHHTRVGAGSVVVTDVPPNSTVVGVPAKFVRVEGESTIAPEAILNHGDLPDLQKLAFDQVFARMRRLEDAVSGLAINQSLGAPRIDQEPSDDEANRMVADATHPDLAQQGLGSNVRPIRPSRRK